MFYSHTFLARKGPLGTVWCAAHLQHKLKKSHYISTNVPSTVDRIMYPEVPLALRMSGHLLLGVVRIYSKQVDYFYEDCNVIRTTINRVFTVTSVNLPEDATQATYHSVTLPENFELDAIELDELGKDWQHDSHLKSRDEITLTEQSPTGKDLYFGIRCDEESTMPSTEEILGSGPVPMEEDVPPAEVDAATEFRTSPSKQLTPNDRNIGPSSPQELSNIEIMRDERQGFDFTNSPMLPDRAEPDPFLEEQINKDNETYTPHSEELPLPGGLVSSPQEKPPSFGRLESPILFEHQSPELQLKPSPPAAKLPVRRKRKLLFDKTIILSNPFIQRSLEDTSDICRDGGNCPVSSLAIWKRNNRLRLTKDGLFHQPYVSGSCADLQDIYKEDAVAVKFPPATTEELYQERTTANQPSVSRHGDDMEMETLRDNEYASPDRHMPDISMVLPSPSERGYSTPHNSNVGLQSERLEATDGGEVLPTAGTGASSGLPDSEIRTPDTIFGKDLQAEHTVLSDIPELSASPRELRFLEQDDISPTGSQGTPESVPLKNQGTPELEALSSRTRAVAQYLKRQASATPLSGSKEESSDGLSLNKILEGKTRKICARMFFQTLVLKSNGFVDVHQEKEYGGITLKVTPKLSKEQFSS